MGSNNQVDESSIGKYEYVEKLIMGGSYLIFDDEGIFFHRDGFGELADIKVKWEEMREVSIRSSGRVPRSGRLIIEINTLLEDATKKTKKVKSLYHYNVG